MTSPSTGTMNTKLLKKPYDTNPNHFWNGLLINQSYSALGPSGAAPQAAFFPIIQPLSIVSEPTFTLVVSVHVRRAHTG